MARFRRTNPDRVRSYSVRRSQAPFDEDALAYCDLIASDPCVYCGGESNQIDHIHPVSRGGDSRWTNLAPACRSCNARKSAKPLLQFLLLR